MIIELDYKCGVRPEQQLADALAGRILTGQIRPGEELPTVRDLALQLQVNPRMVEQAYALLAGLGLAEAGPDGYGWMVRQSEHELAEFRADLVGRLLRRALAQARALEVPREAVEARFATLREEHYGAG